METRRKNVFTNLSIGVGTQIVSVVLGLFVRRIFLQYLATEYLGVNNLFSNVLTVISIAESGAGGVFESCLYVPIFQKNWKKVYALLITMRKFFLVCTFFVIVFGLACIPCFGWVIGNSSIPNIKYVYSLFLIKTVITYLYSHYISLLNAAQKNYLYVLFTRVFSFIQYGLQIFALIIFHSFELFITFQTICAIIPIFLLKYKCKHDYGFVFSEEPEILTASDKTVIKRKIYSGFWIHFSYVLFTGTDTIIITKLLGLYTAGLYANYITVAYCLYAFLQIVKTSFVASIGNYIAEKDSSTVFKLFKRLLFAYMIMVFFCFGCFFILINSFITVWLGEQFLLRQTFVLLFSLSCVFGSYGFDALLSAFKWGAGLYVKDKYCYLGSALANIFLSVLFGSKFGINGILLATVIASAITIVSSSFVLSKYLFKVNIVSLVGDILLYVSLLSCVVAIVYVIIRHMKVGSFLGFFYKSFITAILLFIVMVLFNSWRTECREYISGFYSGIRRFMNKISDRRYRK